MYHTSANVSYLCNYSTKIFNSPPPFGGLTVSKFVVQGSKSIYFLPQDPTQAQDQSRPLGNPRVNGPADHHKQDQANHYARAHGATPLSCAAFWFSLSASPTCSASAAKWLGVPS